MNKLEVIRYEYDADRAIGQVQINGAFFCYSLERPILPGSLAIPEGTFPIDVRAFRGDEKKQYVHLENVPGRSGIAMHGGNEPKDSAGCILVGFSRDDQHIYNSAAVALANKITTLGLKFITVRNGG